jgi:hypothetical protein
MSKLYWVRFYEPKQTLNEFEYHGPWWVSGITDGVQGECAIICAAVAAPNEDVARAVIRNAFDSKRDPAEWSFVEERPEGWVPFGQRFPKARWMQWPWPEYN